MLKAKPPMAIPTASATTTKRMVDLLPPERGVGVGALARGFRRVAWGVGRVGAGAEGLAALCIGGAAGAGC